jgi:cell division protein FtsB
MSMQPTSHRFGVSGYSARRPRLILISLIALCGLFVYGYNGRLERLSTARAAVSSEQARLERAVQKNAELQKSLDEARSDTFLEKVALTILGLSRSGDIPMTMVKTKVPTGADVASSNDTVAARPDPRRFTPVWQQWVDFFTAGASPLP